MLGLLGVGVAATTGGSAAGIAVFAAEVSLERFENIDGAGALEVSLLPATGPAKSLPGFWRSPGACAVTSTPFNGAWVDGLKMED